MAMKNGRSRHTADIGHHVTLKEDKQRNNKMNNTMHKSKKMSIAYYAFDFQTYALVYYPCELYMLTTLYYY
jgi:hypothetical protein